MNTALVDGRVALIAVKEALRQAGFAFTLVYASTAPPIKMESKQFAEWAFPHPAGTFFFASAHDSLDRRRGARNCSENHVL